MREIKFRCWYNQTMYEWKNIVSIEGNFLPNPMICLNKVETGRSDQNVLLSEVQLMQYTGLHDKNGKEIYEGDVVRAMFQTVAYKTKEEAEELYRKTGIGIATKIAQVVWREGVSLDGGYGGFYLIDSKGETPCSVSYASGSEVIGNVWENPGLLEAKEI